MLGREGNVVDGVVLNDKDIEHGRGKGGDADSSSGGSTGEQKGKTELVG